MLIFPIGLFVGIPLLIISAVRLVLLFVKWKRCRIPGDPAAEDKSPQTLLPEATEHELQRPSGDTEERGRKNRYKNNQRKNDLTRNEIAVKILNELKSQKKMSATSALPLDLIYGHGFRDHQKSIARSVAEEYIRDGILIEQQRNRKCCVYLSKAGLVELDRLLSIT